MKFVPSARRRANMEKLAAYLEALPVNYKHFEMETFVGHHGECDLGDRNAEAAMVADPQVFLSNCGAVACAIGHAPAAGVALSLAHVSSHVGFGNVTFASINWSLYAARNFARENSAAWEWMFGGGWSGIDNSHRGAAARIRYLLAGEEIPRVEENGAYGDTFDPQYGDNDLYAQYVVA